MTADTSGNHELWPVTVNSDGFGHLSVMLTLAELQNLLYMAGATKLIGTGPSEELQSIWRMLEIFLVREIFNNPHRMSTLPEFLMMDVQENPWLTNGPSAKRRQDGFEAALKTLGQYLSILEDSEKHVCLEDIDTVLLRTIEDWYPAATPNWLEQMNVRAFTEGIIFGVETFAKKYLPAYCPIFESIERYRQTLASINMAESDSE